MGGSSSSAAGGLGGGNILGGIYASAGGIVGGGKNGLALAEDYANSVYSKAKKELILKLASVASVALKMGKKSFSNVDEAVKFLAKHVPNPRKGERVVSNSRVHQELCETLAAELNAAYGTVLISTSDNSRVCNEVAEVVNSLIKGLHVEFAGVAADVDQISQNLMVLLQYLKENHNKYTELIEKSNDSEIKANAEIVNKFYAKLVEEVERQLAVLNNIVGNVIKPAGKDLVALVQKSDDFKGMVENIKNELGSKEFGEKLGYVLSGVSDSAEAAKIVEQALKEVGLSVAEYKNTRGVEDLKNKIFEALSRSGKQLGGDEIVKFVKAADVLYRYDFRQPQIIEYLKKSGGVDPDSSVPESAPETAEEKPADDANEIKTGGGCGCEGADGGRPSFGAVLGGANGDGKEVSDLFERKVNKRDTISEKTRDLDRFREQLFGDFEKSLLNHYRNVVGIIAQIGPKLGNEIPIDENVRNFVRHFGTMSDTNRNNIAKALSGYNKSGASLANRNRFIADFAKLLTLAAPLASKSSLFKDLENEIKELNNLIELFGEKFVKAIQSPLNPRVKGPYAKGGEPPKEDKMMSGGAEGGDFVPSTISTGNAEKYASFKKAKLQLSYYMAIANIKRSMARAASDDIGSDESYKTMMGQSVARMIDAEAGKMKDLITRIDNAVIAKVAAAAAPEAKDAAKQLGEKAKELAKKQFTARKELLECAQNIDLYLRAFTSDAVSKPDTLIKLSNVLQQFVNIRKFYTNTAGNNLVGVFESFPGGAVGDNEYSESKDYYRDYLAAQNPANHRQQLDLLVGAGPGAGVEIATDAVERVNKFTKKLDNAIYGIRALENLLLAFAQIGNEQTDKTFMSHGKVLNVLSNYIAASAYSVRGQTDPANPADIALLDSKVQYDDGQGADDDENLNGENKILNIALTQLFVVFGGGGRLLNHNGSYRDDFEETNKVFEFILKAICGKILTVLGLYSIYNMPNANYMSISAVRTILGGGADKPTIIPEALELYIRLPLLAEWLRSSFVNVDAGGAMSSMAAAGGYAIAMIPDTTSQWSEFLKLFLIKTTHVIDGNYSESDVYAMVGEINKIYAAYREKSPQDTAYAAMEGLVKDFNSRYGIMKADEVKEYMKKYRSQEDYSALNASARDEDFNDFDLLDSKNARSSGTAPSDRYLTQSTVGTADTASWTSQSMALIKRLHYNIASKFKTNYQQVMGNATIEDAVNVSTTIHGVVEQYKYELASASSDDEKVKIVTKAIQSVGMYSNQNPNKFFMFQEMVVSPLYSLFRLYQVVRQFIGAWEALNRLVQFGATAADPTTLLLAGGNLNAATEVEAGRPPAGVSQLNGAIISAVVAYTRDNDRIAWDNRAPQISPRKLLRFQLSLLTTVKTALNDLVSINVAGTTGVRYPVVDMNAVKDYAGLALENVKKALAAMRAYMPANVIDLFENINNYGSVFWVQSHMMDQLFGNNNDPEPNMDIKKLNGYVKNIFTKTLQRVNHANNVGAAFEAAYDLCYWRMSRTNLVAADLKPVGVKTDEFPGNVIELIDDLNPAAGTVDKSIKEKMFNAAITNFSKVAAAVVENNTANAAAQSEGKYDFLSGQYTEAKSGAVGDIDTLADLKLGAIQDGRDAAQLNLVELQRNLDLVRNAAALYERDHNGSFAPADVAAGAINPADAAPMFGVTGATVTQLALEEYVAAFVGTLNLIVPVANQTIANVTAAAVTNGGFNANFAAVAGVRTNEKRLMAASVAIYNATLASFPAARNDNNLQEIIIDYIAHVFWNSPLPAGAALLGVGSTVGGLNVDVLIQHMVTHAGVLTGIALRGGRPDAGVAVDAAIPGVLDNASVTVSAARVLARIIGQVDTVYMNVQYTAYDPAVLAALGAFAAPADYRQDPAALFILNHWHLKASITAAKNIINRVAALGIVKTRKTVVSPDLARLAKSSSLEMKAYQDLVSGVTTDLAGANTTLIFNTIKMNEDRSFENTASDTFSSFGIVPMFNRTLKRYMDTFFDKLAAKFYSPLIEEFATGHFSPAIVNKQAYSDTNALNDGATAGIGLVKQGLVVASSNARGIRIILNKRDDKGVAKLYALNSLADVSPQMKETMRANLPLFRSAFRELYDQAELLKKLMINTSVKDELKYNQGAMRARPAAIPPGRFRDLSAEPYLDAAAAHPELNQNYFKQALEQVQLGCEVLVKCANQVYKELNDAPLFGETYNGSLAEFKQKTKIYPVTPLSLAQYYERTKLMPGHVNGSTQFKLVYALRGLSDFQIAKAPGYEEILRMYNITVPEGAKMNSKYFEEYTKSHLPLLQTLIRLNGPIVTFNDTRNHLGGLFDGGLELDRASNLPADGIQPNDPLKPIVVQDGILDDLISLITNTDVEYERQRMAERNPPVPLGRGAAVPNMANQREFIQYRNLIETGIVPVNVNALQREVPLVNLLNYAYTFEKSVIDALGVNLHNAGDDIVDPVYPAGADEDAKRMAYSLVHPYGSIPAAAFDGDYRRMLMGDGPNVGKLRFARPKFISDQIWNKLCVRSMLKEEGAERLAVGALAAVAADPSNVHYVKPDGSEDVVRIPNLDAKKVMGKRRFDTVLVRNLVWTVQLHRFLTWNIKEKTRKVLNPVAQGEDAYSPDAVELYGSEGVESYPL